jgi:hypothetical protein
MEASIRFLLVRRGDRPLADGSFPRLGSYYVEGSRRVQWALYLTDGLGVPRGLARWRQRLCVLDVELVEQLVQLLAQPGQRAVGSVGGGADDEPSGTRKPPAVSSPRLAPLPPA